MISSHQPDAGISHRMRKSRKEKSKARQTCRPPRRHALLSIVCVVASLIVVPAFGQVATLETEATTETFDNVGDSLPDGWHVIEGNWRVTDGAIVADSLQEEAYIAFGKSDWQNYEVAASVTFRKVRDPTRWLSVLVRATEDGTKPWSQVAVRFDATQSNGTEFAVRTTNNAWSVRNKASAATKSELNQPRQLKVAVNGPHVQAYLDGKRIVNSYLCVDRPVGCAGLGVSGCIAAFDDVSIRRLPATAAPSVRRAVEAKSCDNVAHRGFSSVAPENTLAAIREAVKEGSTGCEFDVYGSVDGTVVLMHDETVSRTTNGSGKVTELTLKQLQKLDAGSWKDKKYRGERVPTLIEALTLLKSTKCQPVIEIKMEGISQKVVDDVRSLDMVDQVAVIAFSQTVVGEVRELEPKITCAWLCGSIPTETKADTVTQQADWLKKQAKACNATVLDLNYRMLSPKLIAQLKRHGLGVWCWTVNEPVVMRALHQWGVDSITTDHPDQLHRSINQTNAIVE